MSDKVCNPVTKRQIKINGDAFNKLIKAGYIYNSEDNSISLHSSVKDEPVEFSAQKFTPLDPDDLQIKTILSYYSVDHIIHISDIHIPINLHRKRYNEYLSVFAELYKTIRELGDLDKSVITITGDLLHTKLKIEAETLELARDFLYNLSQLTHTIVIIGNHDFAENNKERADTLSAIADRLPVHVLKYTGVYQFGNMAFVFNSLFDNKFIRRSDLHINMPVYALFHGTVVGSKADNGTDLKQSLIKQYPSINDFSGYDAVLLGHIHKRQILLQNIAYAGSLIQQNYGETPEGHGLLRWNTNSHTFQAIDIFNKYIHLNIHVTNGILSFTDKELLEKYGPDHILLLKCHHTDTTAEQLSILQNTLQNSCSIEEFILSRPIGKSFKVDDSRGSGQIDLPVRSLDTDITLISEHAKHVNELIDLHKKYYVPSEQHCGYWCPVKLTWKNIGIYGNNHSNIIDFTRGIISINAPNTNGKTTIITILLYVLYDKVSRSSNRRPLILNKYSNNGYISLEFTHNGSLYTIEKHITKDKDSEKCKINIKSANDNSLNCESSTKTLEYIKTLVGDIDTFLDANVISTRLSNNLIFTKTPKTLLDHFHKICDTSHYSVYKDKGAKEVTRIKKSINKKSGVTEELRNQLNGKDILSLNEIIDNGNIIIDDLSDKMQILCTDRDKLISSIAIIGVCETSTHNLEYIDRELTGLSKLISTYCEKVILDSDNHSIASLKREIASITQFLSNADTKDSSVSVGDKFVPYESLDTLHKTKGKLETMIQMCHCDDEIETEDETEDLPDDISNIHKQIDDINGKISSARIVGNDNNVEYECGDDLDEPTDLDYLLKELIKCKSELGNDLQIPQCVDVTEEHLISRIKQLHSVEQIIKTEHNESLLKKQLSDLLTDPALKERDTWYQSYINTESNTLNNVPLDKFLWYYNNVNSLELLKVTNELNRVAEIQKHNKKVQETIKENKQIASYNLNIELKLESLKRQKLVKRYYVIRTQIQKNVQILTDEKAFLQNILNRQMRRDYRSYIEQLKDVDRKIQWYVSAEKIKLKHLQSVLKYLQTVEKVTDLQKVRKNIIDSKELARLNRELSITDQRIGVITRGLTKSNNDIATAEKLLSDINKLHLYEKEIETLNAELVIYEEYRRLFDSANIPSFALRSRMNQFIESANKVLIDNTKYKVKVDADHLDKGLYFIITDHTTGIVVEPHSLSGYETLVFQVALNRATVDICSTQQSSLFIIDESIDCVDQDRFTSVIPKLCNVIKNQFDATLLISHRDVPHDAIDNKISITHTGTCSYIL
jgi:DNA repair exonuclease SbcCD ATPase subunit/predicted MPP superfamily phosphohydrolase